MAEPNSYFMRGVKLGLAGQARAAYDELSKAVVQDPQLVVAQVSLGIALHNLNEDDRAIGCYDTALQLNRKYAEAHYFRANIFYARKAIPEAITGYTLALGLEPALIEAHQRPLPQDRLTDYTPAAAQMYWIAKPARRIREYDQALQATPRPTSLYQQRATAYYELWNYEQAIADYTSALEMQPADAHTLHARGLAYEQLQQFDRALADYEQALAADPLLISAYINRGVTYGKLGNLPQAIVNLSEAIRLSPHTTDGYYNRGTAYYQQGEFASAVADFSHVIRIAPDDEAAYYWRGYANEQAGHLSAATADFEHFMKISRNRAAKQEVEQKLRQIK